MLKTWIYAWFNQKASLGVCSSPEFRLNETKTKYWIMGTENTVQLRGNWFHVVILQSELGNQLFVFSSFFFFFFLLGR